MTGTILRCNTRIELTVTEFLRLNRMRGAKRAVPARLHCELEQRHDGSHVAFAQSGVGTMTDSAEWWIRWNRGPGRSVRVLALRTETLVLATSLYDDPAAGPCGEAPAGLDEHPSTDCER